MASTDGLAALAGGSEKSDAEPEPAPGEPPAAPGGEQRESWGTRLSFLLAAIGSAIGTGNLWRFPYLCFQYGGGGFLIPYFCSLFMLGIPLMLLELSLGQHRQQGFVRCMTEIHVGFSGLAWATVINSFLSCTFYNVIMAWSLVYLVNSFSLPWAAPAAPAAAAAGCGCSALSTTCRCGEWMVDAATYTSDACSPALLPNSTVVLSCGAAEASAGYCSSDDIGASYYAALANSSAGVKQFGMLRQDVGGASAAETYFYDDVLGRSADITETGNHRH
eukprot:COSAG04_NODE_668_length_11402_cov_3.774976_5_plen_276_part_00